MVDLTPRTTGSIGTPLAAYSSFISTESAQKCGGVHMNTIAKSSQAVRFSEPVTAAQPTSGGIARC